MFRQAKYIITENYEIITFSETIQHKEFKHYKPRSAGFISFGVDSKGEVTCHCYGRSVSLDLDSSPNDGMIAERQLGIIT